MMELKVYLMRSYALVFLPKRSEVVLQARIKKKTLYIFN